MSLRHRTQAWAELLRRYRDVFSYFWSQRQTLSPPSLEAQESDFLPAALSLQTRPVSPVGRWVARIMLLMIVVLLVWSVIGRIDIVVNAQGRVIASGYTKTLAAIEIASVKALNVSEGAFVKAGDVLIELDTRSSDSERDKADGERQAALLQSERSRALLHSIDTGSFTGLQKIDAVDKQRWKDAAIQLQGQWLDYRAKLSRLDGEIQRYAQSLPLAVQRASDYEELAKNHDVSEHAWSEKRQARIDLEGQLLEARNQKLALIAETRKMAQKDLDDANRVTAASSQDQRRASIHSELLKIVAPVDGTVQQLSVHTVGGVVPASQPLMQIVPKQSAVEMEAFLENKDVGFVTEGQEAQVKIDAFEYTKYGTIPAKVSHVSRDAIQDEKRGLIYSVKVTLIKPVLNVDGRNVSISPGMSGNVEIKTGTRRIIEYVLAPLLQHGHESFGER